MSGIMSNDRGLLVGRWNKWDRTASGEFIEDRKEGGHEVN